MKNTGKIIAIIAFAATAFVVSCKKTKTDTRGYVTVITGKVYAELDLTKSGLEIAPAGTKITFLIDPNELLMKPDTSKKYDSYRYVATVGADGIYVDTLPAKNSGTIVQVVMDEFATDQKQFDSTLMRKVFKGLPLQGELKIYAGTSKVQDLYYFYQ